MSRDPASLRPQPKRSGADYWPTPPCLTRALIEHVLPDLPLAPLWECAAGDGRLASAMRAAGHSVVASDIEPRHVDVEQLDFLHNPPPQAGLIATTNPPFNTINRFLARGLQLLDCGAVSGVILLVRCDALTAASRANAFNRACGIWICCWRPVWVEGTKGNGRWSNAWVSWVPDHRGPPVTRCLEPAWQRRQLILPCFSK
jgi:hypothetical protein